MVLSKLNELLIHVRRGNLDLLRNILVDNTLERVPNYMEFIEEEKVPPWLESSDVQNIYKISDSDYTSTTPTSDMSINTETDDNLDLKSIELPIVYPSECEKITIRSSDESSDRKKEAIINTDNLYDYPPVLWIEFPRSPKGNKIQIQSEIEDRDLSYKLLGTLSKKIKSSTSPAKTKIGTPAIVPETHKPPIFLISN